MQVICSPFGIVSPRRPNQGIMDLVNAGFENIFMELSMGCSEQELERCGEAGEKKDGTEDLVPLISENPKEIRRFFKSMAEACQERYLSIPVMRTPCLARDTRRTDLTPRLTKICEEAIGYCSDLGCRFLVVRPLFSGISAAKAWDVNREFYGNLAKTAKEHQVTILLENQYDGRNGGIVRGICSDGRKAAQWIDRLNEDADEERFGFCMDVGVCSLCGQDMYEFAVSLGKRIKGVILRDCDGNRESSMLPFTSVYGRQPRTDWLSLIRGLRETGFDGHLILDMADTAAVCSPLLRPSLLRLAKAVADYVKWQIEMENLLKKYGSVVLFGAGNMCRNYMKCYGDKYPPLFTCDNNKKTWGTTFCGLEVKDPKELKTVPDDCGVFICNIYYREIEKQLRAMGIKNIEYFNDEYMPSFHFDRLKGV